MKLLCLTATLLVACFFLTHSSSADDAGDELRNKLAQSAMENRTRLHFDGKEFSGPALERLLVGARGASFFLIGEEHGIAENPKLVSQLFTELANDDYKKLVIEISPPMARIVDQSLQNGGLDGLRDLFAKPGGEPAFFGMREEAELLAAVRRASPDDADVLWGIDYEVGGDRTLLRELQATPHPHSANQALGTLIEAATASWAQYEETGNPQFIFSFSGDPALVRAVRDSWPDASRHVLEILDTLAAYADVFTLIDLAPLRSIVSTREKTFGSKMLQIVHGFDMLLVMSGSTASSEFEHD